MDIRKKTGTEVLQCSRILPFFALLLSGCLMLAGCKFTDSNNSSSSNGGTPTSVDNNTGNSGSTGNSGGNASAGNDSTGDNTSAPDDAAAQPIILSLSWMPTPGQIDGYIVHTGPSPETATSVLTVTAGTTVEYDAADDLGLNVGDQACFRIKAYNAEGQSGFSDAVCYTVST